MSSSIPLMPILSLRHMFGLKSDVKDNILFYDDQNVIYPAGHNLIIYNLSTNVQRFINPYERVVSPTERSEGFSCMAVSSNRKHIAVAERINDVPSVSIYDVTTRKRRRVLQCPDLGSKEFVALAFSGNAETGGKYLIAQGGAPEYNLCMWQWEKGKLMDKVAASPEKTPITQISFDPRDQNHVCVSGQGVFRFFKFAEGALKPSNGGIARRDHQNYTCHSWLSEDRMLVANDNGDILLLEGGEYKLTLPQSPSDGVAIECIATYTKGFVAGGANGVVTFYEKAFDKDFFRRTKSIRVTENKKSDAGEGSEPDVVRVRCAAISPSEETLVLTTNNSQIFSLNLSTSEIMKAEEIRFDSLVTPFHSAPITGLDVCVRKPLIATCGRDRTVRIWNYLDHSLEVYKQFPSEASCISMHPSGLHVLVGFQDKLKFLNILGDDIREFRSFHVRACPEVRFSNGGQYFAAVNGNIIQIYNTYTCEMVFSLRGHNARIRSMVWSADDSTLVSVGQDGAVYEWNIREQRRVFENVQKTCSYTGVTIDQGSAAKPSVWAVGSDRRLKEIVEGNSVQEIEMRECVLTNVTVSNAARVLFAAADDGSVKSFGLPVKDPSRDEAHRPQELFAHSSAITRMRLSLDESVLFTVSEDGCLVLYDVHDREGRIIKKEITFSEEVLISKSDLDEKLQAISDLRARVEELKLDNEYQIRKKDLDFSDRVRLLESDYQSEMEKLNNRHSALGKERDDMALEFETRIRNLEERHSAETLRIETQYQQKLLGEMDTLHKVREEKNMLNQHWIEQTALKDETHERELQELQDEYNDRLQEEREINETLRQQQRDLIREHDEVRNQIEEDCDREIEELKETYESKLATERELSLRLKGENGIMKKKFSTLQKDIEDKAEQIRVLESEKRDLLAQIASLEKDIVALRKEIRERDDTIGDKEKRIYELKKKNQELEKFKFVLDYKIKELKTQIAPREEDISNMKQQIKEMDAELEKYHTNNNSLELTIADLRLKIDGQNKEISHCKSKIKDAEVYKQRFRTDVHEAIQFIQDPKQLKEAVKRIYQRHVSSSASGGASGDGNGGEEAEGVEDVQKEYARQREYLEKTVESLKRKLTKDMEAHKADNMRIMQENVLLIKEINDLRREIKTLRLQKEADGGGSGSVSGSVSHRSTARVTARGAAPAPSMSMSSPNLGGAGDAASLDDLDERARLHRAFDESQREIEMQRLEIQKLRQHVDILEAKTAVAPRPISRERLPPMEGFADD